MSSRGSHRRGPHGALEGMEPENHQYSAPAARKPEAMMRNAHGMGHLARLHPMVRPRCQHLLPKSPPCLKPIFVGGGPNDFGMGIACLGRLTRCQGDYLAVGVALSNGWNRYFASPTEGVSIKRPEMKSSTLDPSSTAIKSDEAAGWVGSCTWERGEDLITE